MPRYSPDPPQVLRAPAEWAVRSLGSWHWGLHLSSSAAALRAPAPADSAAPQPHGALCFRCMPEWDKCCRFILLKLKKSVLITTVRLPHLGIDHREGVWLIQKKTQKLNVGFLGCHVQGGASAFAILVETWTVLSDGWHGTIFLGSVALA